MSSIGQTIISWGSTVYAATASAGQTVGHALQVGGAKAFEYGQIGVQKLGAGLVMAKESTVYYGGIALDKISAAAAAAKVGTLNGYAAAKPKAITLANSAHASFVAFNAAAVAKVGVVFDSVTKLSLAAVAPYSGYVVLSGTAIGSGVLAGYLLKNTAWKITGVGLALFSTVTTASTIGFVAGAAVPVAAAYGLGAAVPAATYFLVKQGDIQGRGRPGLRKEGSAGRPGLETGAKLSRGLVLNSRKNYT